MKQYAFTVVLEDPDGDFDKVPPLVAARSALLYGQRHQNYNMAVDGDVTVTEVEEQS